MVDLKIHLHIQNVVSLNLNYFQQGQFRKRQDKQFAEGITTDDNLTCFIEKPNDDLRIMQIFNTIELKIGGKKIVINAFITVRDNSDVLTCFRRCSCE